MTHLRTLTAALLMAGCGLVHTASHAAPGGPPCRDAGAASAASAAAGNCPGPGGMHHRPLARWGSDYTPGWMLMTPAEREAFIARMRAAESREQCRSLLDEQRREIEARAKATGQKVPPMPRRNACGRFPPAKP